MPIPHPHVALEQHARSKPDAVALRWITDGGASELTFGELQERACVLAAGLRTMSRHGDRILLLLDGGLDFVVAFFACLHAGRIAVPMAVPQGRVSEAHRRAGVIARETSAACAVVTTAVRARLLSSRGTHGLPEQPAFYVTPDDLGMLGSAAHEQLATPHPVAFLQYTSGSTAAPKGVVVTQRSLADNVARIRERFGFGGSSRGFSWLPAHHDMGLVGCIIQPVCTGFECSLMSPLSFVQRPLRWLDAITRYQIDASGGPCFAYELAAQRIRDEQLEQLDLRSWRVAFVGAEKVRAHVLRMFAERFAPCGFDPRAFAPCYGMAEATLMVAAHIPGEQAATVSLCRSALARGQARPSTEPGALESVACGTVVSGHEVLVVDPETRVPKAPGEVGELWVAGPSVADGYFERPDLTVRDFGGRLASEETTNYLRTGDQGFLLDGQLHLCGRLKTLIVIRGRNYAPEDIEQLLQNDQPVLAPHAGVAFGVERDGGEQLVIVHELQRSARAADLAAIVERAQGLLGRELGLRAAEIVLVKPSSIPRTTSGKLKRVACREQYELGQLSRLQSMELGALSMEARAD